MLKKIIDRLAGEPVAVRAAVAAVLNLLVQLHVIDTGLSHAIDETIAALAAVALVGSARRSVTPTKDVKSATLNAYVSGIQTGHRVASKLGTSSK